MVISEAVAFKQDARALNVVDFEDLLRGRKRYRRSMNLTVLNTAELN